MQRNTLTSAANNFAKTSCGLGLSAGLAVGAWALAKQIDTTASTQQNLPYIASISMMIPSSIAILAITLNRCLGCQDENLRSDSRDIQPSIPMGTQGAVTADLGYTRDGLVSNDSELERGGERPAPITQTRESMRFVSQATFGNVRQKGEGECYV